MWGPHAHRRLVFNLLNYVTFSLPKSTWLEWPLSLQIAAYNAVFLCHPVLISPVLYPGIKARFAITIIDSWFKAVSAVQNFRHHGPPKRNWLGRPLLLQIVVFNAGPPVPLS